MEIFIITFIILTVMHPIGDFISPGRRFKGEFWLVLNPLHALWDLSRFRIHPKYMRISEIDSKHTLINNHFFWKWLGIDQLAHVFLNLLFSVFLQFLFDVVIK